MDKSSALQVFDALAHSTRLDIFQLLVRMEPEGMVAGEIASELGLSPSKFSFHAKVLLQTGLITATQEGLYQRYRANIALVPELIGFLTENCCAGNPSHCAALCTNQNCGC